MDRLRSDPRVCGTMQKVQCMLHPCMIDTKAVACLGASCWSQIVDCEQASSATSTIEYRKSSMRFCIGRWTFEVGRWTFSEVRLFFVASNSSTYSATR